MPNTFWESKGQYDPDQFKVEGDKTVAPTQAAADDATAAAEKMKREMEEALAAMGAATKRSEDAAASGNATLKDVQAVQDSMPKKKY